MNNQEIDTIVNTIGDKPSRSREYMQWLDTEPKIFLSFREWMFTYHEVEYNNTL